jgi:valyl-tRNA synthetase
MPTIPEKPSLEGLEAKWRARWEEEGTFHFDRSKTRDEIYSIDTPPPTVSGALHPGHCCSYTHTDITARFWRMRGKEVFYPMGWDDNGLNTERRVQLLLGITCDPALPYDPDFTPGDEPFDPPRPVSRPNFVEQCSRITLMLEEAYFELWSRLGLSVDWRHTYTTIGERARHTSQAGFLRLLERGLAYRAEAPTLWDVDFGTAVAQAELEDRDTAGAYYRLRFTHADSGEPIFIETTRPELLAACVALVAHPEDERYQPLFGSDARTPLFDVTVPIVAHELAEPDKGSGVAMICTFGDTTDVTWWRELQLPVRAIVGKDGRLTASAPDAVTSERGRAAYAELAGLPVKRAQRRVVELLRDSGELEGEPKPITHPVKFWGNGTRPLEIVTNRQWFVRYPPAEEMLARGKELRWWPDFMRVRYENWVNGLVGDWNITRQRFFGVPFPVWYPIDEDGHVRHDEPIVASVDRLPLDPSTTVPDGYTEAQRDQPGAFTGDPDIMDTWATSSLTPQIVGGWLDDTDLYERVFPMDLRPQAHEIIRTWLFYTIVRSHYEHDVLPWANAAISGFVFDPDRKKFSKSAGNAPDDPMHLLCEFGSDGVRYWAAGGRPGMDIAYDRNQFKVGRRLATKILNASKFVLGMGDTPEDTTPSAPLDLAVLARLDDVIAAATSAFEAYDYTKALERVETFFWTFCDDYLELVKGRAYSGDESALVTLHTALDALLRLFAPFLPFVTEEVWSWWREGSIHRAAWPTATLAAAAAASADPAVLDVAGAVLGDIRKAKSDAKRSLRTEVERAEVTGTAEELEALAAAQGDVLEAGRVANLATREGDALAVTVALAPA